MSGEGSLQVLSAHKNQKILLVCDNFLLKSGGAEQLLRAVDDSCEVKIFAEVVPDPPIAVVSKALSLFLQFEPQLIIAMGGGSAIDTAKGILYFAKQMSSARQVKLIAVPTTSGTGSEVTAVTVLTEPETKIKHMIIDEVIVPDEAILDASLTLSVPPAITANTGMDVLTHALEAYVATGANSFSDAMAEKSVEFVYSSLLDCYRDGSNKKAREKMHEASTFAGIAFDQAGLGIAHSLAHQLGGAFHISHGLANALVLREVILYNSADPKVKFKYADIARRTGICSGGQSDEQALLALIEYIEGLKAEMGMANTFRECGVSSHEFESSLQEIAANSLKDRCTLSNPTKIATDSAVKILKSLY